MRLERAPSSRRSSAVSAPERATLPSQLRHQVVPKDRRSTGSRRRAGEFGVGHRICRPGRCKRPEEVVGAHLAGDRPHTDRRSIVLRCARVGTGRDTNGDRTYTGHRSNGLRRLRSDRQPGASHNARYRQSADPSAPMIKKSGERRHGAVARRSPSEIRSQKRIPVACNAPTTAIPGSQPGDEIVDLLGGFRSRRAARRTGRSSARSAPSRSLASGRRGRERPSPRSTHLVGGPRLPRRRRSPST
jgi:hypothetical protein